jgi:UDP-glucose 4-epimerase
MRILVTGSSGHLGEALVRTLRDLKHEVIGLDISATTPFLPEDLPELRANAPLAVWRRVPGSEAEFQRRGWKMFPTIDRVYVNERARTDLGWHPRYDFNHVLERLRAGDGVKSPLARMVGSKRYHADLFAEGPYPLT